MLTNMKKKLLILFLVLLIPIVAYAATFETYTTGYDNQRTLSLNSVGQTITATSDHTITSIDIHTSGAAGVVNVHIVGTSAGVPVAPDLALATNISVPGSVGADSTTNVTFSSPPCVASGVVYAYWIEYVSGGPFADSDASSPTYTGGTMYVGSGPSVVPASVRTGEDNLFTIYGDAQSCTAALPISASIINFE